MYDPSKFIEIEEGMEIDFENLIEMFETNLNVTPQLICKKDKAKGIQVLTEVRLTLDVDFKILRLDSNKNHSRCSKKNNILL